MSKTASWLQKAHKNAGWIVALGVIKIVLGVLLLMSPLVAGLAATAVLGFALIAGGLMRLVAAFGADSFGAGVLGLLWGLVVAVSGAYVVMNPGIALLSLTLVLAVMFLVSGLSEISTSLKLKPVKGWGWALAGGIVTVIMAVMVWRQFPEPAVWLPGTLVGVQMFFSGMTTMSVGTAARQVTAA
jgi:uncharacterized membrane protein HdeD (DUF308 family)